MEDFVEIYNRFVFVALNVAQLDESKDEFAEIAGCPHLPGKELLARLFAKSPHRQIVRTPADIEGVEVLFTISPVSHVLLGKLKAVHQRFWG